MISDELRAKYEGLKELLASYGSVAVAFSGGVDSSFLLYAAKDALGDRTVALTAVSCLFPARETSEAKALCKELGVRQVLLEEDPFSIEGFAQNPPERCYICKHGIFSLMLEAALAEGMDVLAEGSNLDDMGDYRPGLKAIAELKVKSPLREAGFKKSEIRELSRHFGLPTGDKPSFACLASRFPYGDTITREKLHMVEAAEQLLLDLGFKQLRVRMHGDIARIELLAEDMPRFMEPDIRLRVDSELKALGFRYVSLDLRGYRTGSMNEGLPSL